MSTDAQQTLAVAFLILCIAFAFSGCAYVIDMGRVAVIEAQKSAEGK